MTDVPDYAQLNRATMDGIMKLARAQGPVMKANGALHQAATGAGALDTKTKELIAIALAVAARCDGCIGLHVKAALDAGASREEIADTCGVAVMMGGGPAAVYAGRVMQALDDLSA